MNDVRKPKISYVRLDSLGFDLREERERNGWSQRETAKMLGCSYQSYQNWEQGLTKAVFPKTAEKMKEVFGFAEDDDEV